MRPRMHRTQKRVFWRPGGLEPPYIYLLTSNIYLYESTCLKNRLMSLVNILSFIRYKVEPLPTLENT